MDAIEDERTKINRGLKIICRLRFLLKFVPCFPIKLSILNCPAKSIFPQIFEVNHAYMPCELLSKLKGILDGLPNGTLVGLEFDGAAPINPFFSDLFSYCEKKNLRPIYLEDKFDFDIGVDLFDLKVTNDVTSTFRSKIMALNILKNNWTNQSIVIAGAVHARDIATLLKLNMNTQFTDTLPDTQKASLVERIKRTRQHYNLINFFSRSLLCG